MLQMYLRPRDVLPLVQVSKSWRIVIECNKEYWTRVAAHLVFANSLLSLDATRFSFLVYTPEGYYAAMNEVISRINKEVEIFGTIGFELSSDDNDEMAAECKTVIEYWKPYIHASLEVKTRMQLLDEHNTLGDSCRLTVQQCHGMTMKEIAKTLVMKMVTPREDEQDEKGAKKLREWVREFKALPNLSDDTKSSMMRKLLKCFDGNFKDGRFVMLNGYDVRDAVEVACYSNDYNEAGFI